MASILLSVVRQPVSKPGVGPYNVVDVANYPDQRAGLYPDASGCRRDGGSFRGSTRRFRRGDR
ncbi:hypothetical protein HYPGJ_10599 [Hyphomicrobium sp. GJ21]|nr:hypothetical protein HYPGJ_10599 [Hyphomicrobium sp. GJ21]